MDLKKIIFAGIVAASFNLCVFAQEQKQEQNSTETIKLTISDAVDMAIQNNISIKQSKMQLELLEKKDKYSWNSVSPSISLSGGVSDSLPHGNFDNSLSYSVSGGVSARFTPALITTMQAAKIALENGEISYDKAVRTVEKNVRSTFYQLLNMKETIASSQQAIDTAKRTYDSNLQKYNRGYLDELTLLNSQYNYERQLPSLDSAKNNYQSYLDNLKQVLGIPLSDDIELEGSLDEILDLQLSEEILTQSLEEIPSVVTVKQNIKSTENSIAATKYTAYGPTVSASYNLGAGGGTSGQEFGISNHSVSLSVSVPLDGYLPWSSSALSIESLEATLESQKMDLENAKTTAMISIRSSYNSIINAQNQLKLYESNLELAQKSYDMTLVQYNNGSKDLSALQSAEDNLSTARYSLQGQKYTIINSVLNLEDTLGLPFGSLNQKSENK